MPRAASARLNPVDSYDLDITEMCRDERCHRIGIHRTHSIRWSADTTDYHPERLPDAVLRCVHQRVCRPFSQIHHLVLESYGPVHRSTLHAILRDLCEARKVILVLPPGVRRRLAHPTVLDEPGGQAALGAYIDASSPLLFDADDVQCLFEQVEDLLRHRSQHLND